jgi:glycosyltransferase involved in cell wall biosynthesis
VPARDEEALRRRLSALRADPEMARRVGAAGRTHVSARHSREAMVRRYLELYAQVGARA